MKKGVKILNKEKTNATFKSLKEFLGYLITESILPFVLAAISIFALIYRAKRDIANARAKEVKKNNP